MQVLGRRRNPHALAPRKGAKNAKTQRGFSFAGYNRAEQPMRETAIPGVSVNLLARRTAAILVGVLGLAGTLGGASAGQPAATVYLRVNQVGYLPAEPKTALALTDAAL